MEEREAFVLPGEMDFAPDLCHSWVQFVLDNTSLDFWTVLKVDKQKIKEVFLDKPFSSFPLFLSNLSDEMLFELAIKNFKIPEMVDDYSEEATVHLNSDQRLRVCHFFIFLL